MKWFRVILLVLLLWQSQAEAGPKECFGVLGFSSRIEKLDEEIVYNVTKDDYGRVTYTPSGVDEQVICSIAEAVLVDSLALDNRITLRELALPEESRAVEQALLTNSFNSAKYKGFDYLVLGFLNNITIADSVVQGGIPLAVPVIIEGSSRKVKCQLSVKVIDVKQRKVVFVANGEGASRNVRSFVNEMVSFGRKGIAGESHYNAIQYAVEAMVKKLRAAI